MDLGTKRNLIYRILGERGEKILQDLLDNKILKEENGRIKLRSGTDFTCDFKLIAQKYLIILASIDQSGTALKKTLSM